MEDKTNKLRLFMSVKSNLCLIFLLLRATSSEKKTKLNPPIVFKGNISFANLIYLLKPSKFIRKLNMNSSSTFFSKIYFVNDQHH